MPQHVTIPNHGAKVGLGTIAAALAALSMAVLGHFLFGEPFGIKQIGGIVLIMGGVLLINQT